MPPPKSSAPSTPRTDATISALPRAQVPRLHEAPALALSLALSLGLTGCPKGGDAETPPPGTAEAASTAAPASTGEPVSAASSVDFHAVSKQALSGVTLPAAAVVMSVRDRKLLGLAEVNGGDATRTALRPGSTMKPLLAYSAIMAGVPVGPFTCEEKYRGMHCFARHGELELEKAIAVSCNTYFFDLAHTMGHERVTAGLRSFGLGAPTGLSEGESSGNLPAFKGDEQGLDQQSMAMAAGHGMLRVTLVQLAGAYATLATRLTEIAGKTDERSRSLARISAGVRDVVEKEWGTGREAAVEGLEIAGKTGTAEGGTALEPEGESAPMNRWFVAYAPASAPEIVVAVEVTGGGAKSAAPVAGEIFRSFQAARAR
ncbi:MAG: penicillin-binding transpeptidase domain-containing protein [Polyangiaceae bacterium]